MWGKAGGHAGGRVRMLFGLACVLAVTALVAPVATADVTVLEAPDDWPRRSVAPIGVRESPPPFMTRFSPEPTGALVRSLSCPVLYTHEVWSPSSLVSTVRGLMVAGYRPTSLAEVDAAMRGDVPVPPGCLVLSFDDARASQYRHALPALTAMGVPAVFFVLPGFADGVHQFMTTEEIWALHAAGHEVMAHTCNHPHLPILAGRNRAAFLAEVVDCKRIVEEITGVPAPYFAYPYGKYDAQVAEAVSEAGYRLAFTTLPGTFHSVTAPLALPRITFSAGESAGTVGERIRQAGRVRLL